jgi:PAS domain S-box-containing protein
MKIKTKLQLIIICNILILVGIVSVSLLSEKHADRESMQEALITKLHQAVFERARVREEYFLYREERSKEQFLLIHKQIGGLVGEMSGAFTGPGEKASLIKMMGFHNKIEGFFNQLVRLDQSATAHTATAQALRERIISQMLVNAHSMYDEGLKLLNAANEKTVYQNTLYHLYSTIVFGLLAFFIAALAVIIIRSITYPLTRLHKGTEIVAEGNLDYKTNIRTPDEIGRLSTAFDAMTEHLREITVSRDELNKDIEERKRAEEALRESETRFKQLFDSVNDGITLRDAETYELLDANRRFCEMWGYNFEELKGLPTGSLSALEEPVEQRGKRLIAYYAQAAEGIGSLLEWPARRKDGSRFWVELNGTRMIIGTRDCLLLVVRDITARKQAEEALRVTNDVFSLFMRHSPIYTFIKEVTPTRSFVLQASDNYHEMIGVSGGEMIGKTMSELFPAEFAAKITADDWATVSCSKVVELEEEFNGRSYTTIKFPILQGDKALLAGYTIDITERKQGEEALKLSEDKYRSLVESSSDAIFMLDTQRIITSCNQAFLDLFGYEREEVENRSVRLIHVSDASFEAYGQKAYSVVQKQGTFRTEWNFARKDGTTVDVESVTFAIKGPDGAIKKLAGIIRDITERKQSEEKIKASLKEKEVLLKEIHHRVKNNLQIVSSLLFLQETRTEHPVAAAVLKESRNRVKSMALIHERLYQSPNLGSVDMGKYTRNLVSDLRRSYGAENSLVRLTVTVEDITLGITEAIPCGLIINELVSNALKHAFPKGRAGELTIQLVRGNTNQITLTVSDNGIGFPEHVDFRQSPSWSSSMAPSNSTEAGGQPLRSPLK